MNTEYPKKIAENVTMYSGDPILYVVNEFVSDLECEAFIEASNSKEYVAALSNLGAIPEITLPLTLILVPPRPDAFPVFVTEISHLQVLALISTYNTKAGLAIIVG